MKITPQNHPIPFTERNFVVEMTGLELAIFKNVIGSVGIAGDVNFGRLNCAMYQQIPIQLNYGDIEGFKCPANNVVGANLETFKQKINDLNK